MISSSAPAGVASRTSRSAVSRICRGVLAGRDSDRDDRAGAAEQDRARVRRVAAREAVDVAARLGPVARVEVGAGAVGERRRPDLGEHVGARASRAQEVDSRPRSARLRPTRSSSRSSPSAFGKSGASARISAWLAFSAAAAVDARVQVARRGAHVDPRGA